ncbi:hypothetical protein EI94DRAFT_1729950 [Lactarius quietus]|nr:hypothetical protein EI94DRAFT_1729950 [Lactarius quietus]
MVAIVVALSHATTVIFVARYVVTPRCCHKLSPFVVSNRVIVAPVIVLLSSALGLGPGSPLPSPWDY